jgi:hypothetical protein
MPRPFSAWLCAASPPRERLPSLLLHLVNEERKTGLLLGGGRNFRVILGGSINPQIFIPMIVGLWRRRRLLLERLKLFR